MQKYTIVHRYLAALDDFLERLICWTYPPLAPLLETIELEGICWRFKGQTW